MRSAQSHGLPSWSQAELPDQVDHAEAQADGVLDDHEAAAGVAVVLVGAADDRLAAVEVRVDLAVAVGVVAERDHVDAEFEDLVGGLRIDAHAAGGVLAVDDDEVGIVLFLQARQHRG